MFFIGKSNHTDAIRRITNSRDDDSRPEHGGRHGQEEGQEETMIAFTNARVEPRTVMIETTNAATAVLAVTSSQRLLHITTSQHHSQAN